MRKDGSVFIFTVSLEQYVEEKIIFTNEVGGKESNYGAFVVFDDMLESIWRLIDPFFTRGRQKNLNVSYISQPFHFAKSNYRK